MMGNIKRFIYIVLGSIALALGVLGIPLPVLPTTPFLLLAAWCYLRSSERLYNWLLNTDFLGSYIKSFYVDKAIPLHAKIISVSMMWATMIYTSFWVIDYWWLRVILLLIAVAVTFHILSYTTKK